MLSGSEIEAATSYCASPARANVVEMDPHPRIGRKELVPQTLFSLYMMVYV
jgi:hypothetical protein